MLKLPLVIVGPSGVGKTVLVNTLLSKYPDKFEFSVSCTTRPMRKNEKNQVNYDFITKELFQSKIKLNEFAEWAEVHGNLYGTTKAAIFQVQTHNKICLLDIDVQGAISLYSSKVKFNCVSILPKNEESIRKRLVKRASETPESLLLRMENMKKELEIIKKNPEIFTNFLVNDDLEVAKNELFQIVNQMYGNNYLI